VADPDGGYGGGVLLDNSAWARLGLGRLRPADQQRFDDAVRADQLVVCPPFALEALYSARDAADHRALQTELGGFCAAVADGRTWQLAARAQQALAQDRAVSHRVKPIDLLIAAIADQHALGILHYDRDYDVILEHSPLTFRSVWVADRGTID
jgi:predicted nucleic acid-binding protein